MTGLENPLHIAIILIVLLLVFGAKKLPEMGKGLGEGFRGFRSSLHGEETAPAKPAPVQSALTTAPPAVPTSAEQPQRPAEQPQRSAEQPQRASEPVA